MGQSPAERQRLYRLRHPDRVKDACPNCQNPKKRNSRLCRKCNDASKTGVLSPYYKGGYECHLEGMRLYAKRRRDAIGHHSQKEWEELKNKFNKMCLCCKTKEPEIKLQKDHIVPLTEGGSDNIENIQPLCASCNSRKYTKIINFIELLEKDKATKDL